MKQVLIAGLIAVSSVAHAEDISVAAGRCGAFHLVRNNLDKAQLAANHAENKGKMQVAANRWLELAKTNPKEAVAQAQMSCIYTLRIDAN